MNYLEVFMRYFELWHESLKKSHGHIDAILGPMNTSKEFIIYGSTNSGKSSFIEHILTNLRMNQKQDKKIDEIIKISFSEYLSISTLVKNDQSLKERIIENVEINFNLNLGPVELALPLDKILKPPKKASNFTIFWFDNVTLDGQLSIDKANTLLKNFSKKNRIIFFSTRDENTKRELEKAYPDAVSETMPSMTYNNVLKHKKRENKEVKLESYSIFTRLMEIAPDDARELIKIGDGAYGNVAILIDLYENSQRISSQSKIEKVNMSLLEMIKQLNMSHSIDVLRMVLFILFAPKLISIDWFETLFSNSDYDYVSDIDQLIERKIIIEHDGTYTINTFLSSLQEDCEKSLINKRMKRSMLKLMDTLLKSEFPEKYSQRSINARQFDKHKSEEYYFIQCLRNKDRISYADYQSVFPDNIYLELLKILNSSFNDIPEDLEKVINELKAFKPRFMPVLIASEYQYFKLNILLSYPYNERKRVRPKIELLLHTMIHLFDELVEQNESEMAIKMALLIAPEIINYLGDEDIENAERIYKYAQKSIYLLKKKNYAYYKYYDVVCKLKSTSIINYRKSSYLLWSVLDEFESVEDVHSLNYTNVIPTVFCNLLGLSFYLGENELLDSCDFYKSNKSLIKSFEFDDYKISNNLMLAEILKVDITRDKLSETYEKKWVKLRDKHVSTINYAGILFYRNKFSDAKKVLKDLLKAEPTDDFYIFYCQYNLILIELCSKIRDNEKAEEWIGCLEIPSLFTDKTVVRLFKQRIQIIHSIAKKRESMTPEKLDKIVIEKMRVDSPFFKRSWAFSDYQYWS